MLCDCQPNSIPGMVEFLYQEHRECNQSSYSCRFQGVGILCKAEASSKRKQKFRSREGWAIPKICSASPCDWVFSNVPLCNSVWSFTWYCYYVSSLQSAPQVWCLSGSECHLRCRFRLTACGTSTKLLTFNNLSRIACVVLTWVTCSNVSPPTHDETDVNCSAVISDAFIIWVMGLIQYVQVLTLLHKTHAYIFEGSLQSIFWLHLSSPRFIAAAYTVKLLLIYSSAKYNSWL